MLGALAVRAGDANAARSMVREFVDWFYRRDNIGRIGQGVAVAAGIAFLRVDTHQAAALLSAATKLWQLLWEKDILRQDYQAEYERVLPRVRDALPPAEFEVAWAEGQAMTLDQVI
jgi:hypothetical protein